MQQRFCTCGHAVWVQYILPNNRCRVVFRPANSHGHLLKDCPLCRKRLDIDELS